MFDQLWKRRFLSGLAVLGALLLGGAAAWAASKAVDLDGDGVAESTVTLNVISVSPPTVQNVVTNRSVGETFLFEWFSGAPGGFSSTVAPGTAEGVGVMLTWQTTNPIYSYTGSLCQDDICFTVPQESTGGSSGSGNRIVEPPGRQIIQTDDLIQIQGNGNRGSVNTKSQNLGSNQIEALEPGTVAGPFSVPGRTLIPGGITTSSGALTSAILTFFSPPTVVFTATSEVKQSSSGQLNYSLEGDNPSGTDVTVIVPAFPPGCCPEENQLNCAGNCVDYLTDPLNCGECGFSCNLEIGEICNGGTCEPACPVGEELCGDICADLTSDPDNCGTCENSCGGTAVCSTSLCLECFFPVPNACDNECVSLTTDIRHCGACGIDCSVICPAGTTPSCSLGTCECLSTESTGLILEAAAESTVTAEPESSAGSGSSLQDPAPRCEFEGSVETIQSGSSGPVYCQSTGYLAKEIINSITVCGKGTPDGNGICPDGTRGTTGVFNQLVPDFTKPLGAFPVVLSSDGISLNEPSGDGLWQPSEAAQIKVRIVNSGSMDYEGACATLVSPAQDITPEDGINNPTTVDILTDVACYPLIPGVPTTPGTDCLAPEASVPVDPLTPFVVSIPASYLGDTSRLFFLQFTGTAGGNTVETEVPISLGISGLCNLYDGSGGYDELDGLKSPMAKLIPEEDTQPLPSSGPFAQGKTRPMKLTMSCAGTVLDESMITAPEIVDLYNLTTDERVDIKTTNINDSPNSNDPFFRAGGGGGSWVYNLRTKSLDKGFHKITIRIGGRKNYVTGFELN